MAEKPTNLWEIQINEKLLFPFFDVGSKGKIEYIKKKKKEGLSSFLVSYTEMHWPLELPDFRALLLSEVLTWKARGFPKESRSDRNL